MNEEMQPSGAKGRVRKYFLAGTVALLGLGAIGAVQADPMGFRGHGFGGPMGGFGIERALRSVDASAEQREQIWTIVDAARTEIRPLVSEMHDRREQVATLLKAETLDRAAFETLRQETIATADAVSARGMAAFLDAAEVLTPEQRAELLEARERGRFGPGRR